MEGLSFAMRELPGQRFEPVDCGSPPPKAIQPVPLSSMTTPGSKTQLQGSTPGMPCRMRALLSGDLNGPTGDEPLMTPTLPPPLAK